MKRLTPRQLEALKIVSQGRFLPTMAEEEDGYHARWRPVSTDPAAQAAAGWVDEYVRAAAMTPLSEDAEYQRHETLHDAWMMALKSRTGLIRWDAEECAAFAAELRDWSGIESEAEAARRALTFVFAAGESFAVSCAVPTGRAALKALGQAAFVWGRLREMRVTGDGAGRRLRVTLDRNEAEDFIRRGAGELREAGYAVEGVLPPAAVVADADIGGTRERPVVKLTVRVDGEPVSAEEIRFLLEQNSSLVFFRNRWIEVDRSLLKEALRALERTGKLRLSPVGFAMGIGAIGRLEIAEVAAHGWLRGLVNELRSRGETPVGELRLAGFAGELRDYQRRGVKWLSFLTAHGFGALLADDMGLGKTVQTIAWILNERQSASAAALRDPVLIVAPLTLLANWRHEFETFAPSLSVYVHHGGLRHLASGFLRAAREADVVLTSYSLLVREEAAFAEVRWGALVLDEAQAIKNPDTQAARAVRALMPPKRVALTGTPIENSVADIWSIEEFLNPGFLGDRASFEERFVRPLALDPSSALATKLAHALEPFVLRRLKTDPGIAAELGEKREIGEYCELDPAARADYEAALADFRAGERRQGDAFALLTRLKLICDGAGKLARLEELLDSVFAGGESALVFTQYARVGAMLQKALQERFARSVPFLHGGLERTAREREIRRFNAAREPAVFVLSLKAGGFGLNLTKATHVIHFDRWWNPAVENQATDRAHRIGQERTVFVHRFITVGTLEERIDALLKRKQTLEGIIRDGEEFERLVGLE